MGQSGRAFGGGSGCIRQKEFGPTGWFREVFRQAAGLSPEPGSAATKHPRSASELSSVGLGDLCVMRQTTSTSSLA